MSHITQDATGGHRLFLFTLRAESFPHWFLGASLRDWRPFTNCCRRVWFLCSSVCGDRCNSDSRPFLSLSFHPAARHSDQKNINLIDNFFVRCGCRGRARGFNVLFFSLQILRWVFFKNLLLSSCCERKIRRVLTSDRGRCVELVEFVERGYTKTTEWINEGWLSTLNKTLLVPVWITWWKSEHWNVVVIKLNCQWSGQRSGVFLLILSAFSRLLHTCRS